MANDGDPMLMGTEKDYAWDAWQRAFGEGRVLLPDRAKFEKYFDEIYRVLADFSLHDRLQSAWNSGVLDRNEQGTAGFNAWWQQILDSQPVISKG